MNVMGCFKTKCKLQKLKLSNKPLIFIFIFFVCIIKEQVMQEQSKVNQLDSFQIEQEKGLFTFYLESAVDYKTPSVQKEKKKKANKLLKQEKSSSQKQKNPENFIQKNKKSISQIAVKQQKHQSLKPKSIQSRQSLPAIKQHNFKSPKFYQVYRYDSVYSTELKKNSTILQTQPSPSNTNLMESQMLKFTSIKDSKAQCLQEFLLQNKIIDQINSHKQRQAASLNKKYIKDFLINRSGLKKNNRRSSSKILEVFTHQKIKDIKKKKNAELNSIITSVRYQKDVEKGFYSASKKINTEQKNQDNKQKSGNFKLASLRKIGFKSRNQKPSIEKYIENTIQLNQIKYKKQQQNFKKQPQSPKKLPKRSGQVDYFFDLKHSNLLKVVDQQQRLSQLKKRRQRKYKNKYSKSVNNRYLQSLETINSSLPNIRKQKDSLQRNIYPMSTKNSYAMRRHNYNNSASNSKIQTQKVLLGVIQKFKQRYDTL